MQFGEDYTFTMQISANLASPRVHEMNKSPIAIEIEDSVLQPNPCDLFSYSHTILSSWETQSTLLTIASDPEDA
jgi:hypothetical protein